MAIALMLTATSAGAATITYVLPDIGTFTNYTNSDTSETFAGDGFVGMYNVRANGVPAWVHLFGIEDFDYSRTIGQVDLSALAGATINSATFTFEILNGCEPCTQDVQFSYFAEDGALSYDWAPATLGSGVYSVSDGANALDVTSFVSAFLAGGGDWFGFHLQGSDEFQWTYTDTDADRALVRLNIDYSTAAVPEPITLLLLGSGLVLGYRRMRRA